MLRINEHHSRIPCCACADTHLHYGNARSTMKAPATTHTTLCSAGAAPAGCLLEVKGKGLATGRGLLALELAHLLGTDGFSLSAEALATIARANLTGTRGEPRGPVYNATLRVAQVRAATAQAFPGGARCSCAAVAAVAPTCGKRRTVLRPSRPSSMPLVLNVHWTSTPCVRVCAGQRLADPTYCANH
jgi:hypothetical protein